LRKTGNAEPGIRINRDGAPTCAPFLFPLPLEPQAETNH
jgi:hypothetical protein